jgi:hypothetical protein
MSNSIHFEQLFERFSRFLDREFRPAGERRSRYIRSIIKLRRVP